MSATLSHTLTTKRTWYIRLYLWVYGADEDSMNSCKLLWAYALMVLALPISVALRVFWKVAGPSIIRLDDRLADRRARIRRETYAENLRKAEAGTLTAPSRAERFLEGFAAFMSKIWFKIQPLLKVGGIILGLILGALLVYLAVTATGGVLSVLFWIAIVFVSALVVLAVGIALGEYLDRRRIKKRRENPDKVGFGTFLKRLGRTFHDHTCANIKIADED